MKNVKPRHLRPGFTLIELIVAMGMVAILSVSLYASLRIAFRARESAEKTIEPSRTAELAMEFILTDLQNAMTPNPGAADPNTISNVLPTAVTGSFVGTDGKDGRGHDADDLIFFSTADSPQHVDGTGDIKQIELAVVQAQGSGDYVLVRRVTPNLLAPTTPNPDEEVICRGVGGFNLRYYNGAAWSDTWDSTQTQFDNTIPVAVEVTLQLDRPINSGQMQSYRYVRIFPLSCSTAAYDPAVNPNVQ
jgi:prepilin-type N-terminal cleavage/methylation domain-containing protein